MSKRKRNREGSVNRVGLCVHIKDGKCKHPDRCGSPKCAKNKCCDFKDPKDPKNKK